MTISSDKLKEARAILHNNQECYVAQCPMYGEPYCPCEMKRKGLEGVMENNPVRKAAEEESARAWAKFWEEGGFSKYETE